MRTILLTLLIAVASCGGPVHGTVSVSTPDLVYVAPGVRVIADYGESIFFVDGFYWWYVDGLWYRSTYYTGGWVYIASPPLAVIRIGDPVRFKHYRPSNYVVRSRPLPPSRIQRPVVRDHRRR
ncbi:MAG: hypothetical protein AB7T06_30120 [Kofleriaceae bacterium]